MPKTLVTQENFNEQAYLASNPDVAAAVKKGDFKSGKEHFKKFGSKENRVMNLRSDAPQILLADTHKNEKTNLNDYYVLSEPSSQNLIDLFQGEWSSHLPANSGLIAEPGFAGLFEDQRVIWAKTVFSGFDDYQILELGPLEAGHTYMFQKLGAKRILAIEANSRAFLKCLCIKEIFKLDRAEFKLGDFISYLRLEKAHYDMVFASGVLYHMENPVELLKLMSKVSDRIFIWTQYFDGKIISQKENLAHKFSAPRKDYFEGFEYEYSVQSYKNSLDWSGFCGGPEPTSKWLTRESILSLLRNFGFTETVINFDEPDHPNGPAFAICAQK